LGYVSSADCKIIASVRLEADFAFCMVQTTGDGMGLLVVLPDITGHISVFEIYPQSETPLLTQIAHLDWDYSNEPAHCLPDTLIFREISEDRIVFKVLDYRVNYSTRFQVNVDFRRLETFATKTAIIVFCPEEVLVWAIPSLLPRPYGHFLDNYPFLPPRFRIPFPHDIVYKSVEPLRWNIMSSWYFGSWESIYFDTLCGDSRQHRFKMIVKPDLSDASLHFINTCQLTAYDSWHVSFQRYRICEDTIVSCWRNSDTRKCGAYTGLTSATFTNLSEWGESGRSLCPASGRFVYFANDDDDEDNDDGKIIVVDFF